MKLKHANYFIISFYHFIDSRGSGVLLCWEKKNAATRELELDLPAA
jgi:hypothetical protein